MRVPWRKYWGNVVRMIVGVIASERLPVWHAHETCTKPLLSLRVPPSFQLPSDELATLSLQLVVLNLTNTANLVQRAPWTPSRFPRYLHHSPLWYRRPPKHYLTNSRNAHTRLATFAKQYICVVPATWRGESALRAPSRATQTTTSWSSSPSAISGATAQQVPCPTGAPCTRRSKTQTLRICMDRTSKASFAGVGGITTRRWSARR